ncbi:MAG: KUP/HAK/KT family potassium transporter [Fimbriimonadaceae bacterium]|nr:KUP/HAK/KT family potassium transporter [Chitinophagales bacterium]
MASQKSKLHKYSAGGVLITLGIIYGDIGTSPLYVMRAITENYVISKELIYGGVSAVFWTLMLITTFKYVYLALNNDNKGEGGIFALYALLRRYKIKWAIVPALIGCAALIADGFITPSISISSAVEGLNALPYVGEDINTIPIVVVILAALFLFQQFGTKAIGSALGPVMTVWFLMIGTLGFLQIIKNPSVFEALNPAYAINLITSFDNGKGFWLLGAVFLCTTGAEALYSDLGHCGKQNIRIGWIFVFVMLMLNYLGQAAYLLSREGTMLTEGESPFYSMMAPWFLPVGVIVATCAAVIASQALITGCFTLVNEAMKLKLWPNFKVFYPSTIQGQIYIPAINWFLFAGSLAVVYIFKNSTHMEAAYGLAITIDMLMTTTLLVFLLRIKQHHIAIVILFATIFYLLEGSFFLSNILKFYHGGWFTISVAAILFFGMWIFYKAKNLRSKHTNFVEVNKYIAPLQDLMSDDTIAKEATNLVYLAVANDKNHIDSNIIYSIFRKKPKRADIYWFVHVDIKNDPYGASYSVDTIIPKRCFFIKLTFGFKVEHKVNLMFNKIVNDMVTSGEVDGLSHYQSLRKHNLPADFKFILLNSRVASDDKLTPWEMFVVKGYRFIKSLSLSTAEDFGLEQANLEEEIIPIRISKSSEIILNRTK